MSLLEQGFGCFLRGLSMPFGRAPFPYVKRHCLNEQQAGRAIPQHVNRSKQRQAKTAALQPASSYHESSPMGTAVPHPILFRCSLVCLYPHFSARRKIRSNRALVNGSVFQCMALPCIERQSTTNQKSLKQHSPLYYPSLLTLKNTENVQNDRNPTHLLRCEIGDSHSIFH